MDNELLARSHHVTLVTNEHFVKQAAANDFDFVTIGTEEEFRNEFENPDIWRSCSVLKILGRS